MEYGLIGERLGHSYSKEVHEALSDYDYQLKPLPTEAEARAFMEEKNFKAINVTIPYKELVIPYCEILEPKAAAIHTVNTIVNRNGVLHGYNTDYDGFLYLAKKSGVDFKGRTVLILGTGGTSRTVHAVAMDEGAAQVLFASRTGRNGAMTYDQVDGDSRVNIIVNTSPAGMYPNVGECLVQPKNFPNLEAVLDVVYNPFKTELVLRGEEAGVISRGGLQMLVSQAVYTARHFTRYNFSEIHIDPICHQIFAMRANICLIGMPSSGKTTIGRQLAKMLNRTFVDLDAEIEKEAGCTIPEIFATQGEEAFRELEQKICARFGKENTQVISCGGGIVKRAQNIRNLRQNGLLVFIDRPVELLHTGGHRPLSGSMEQLKVMEQERRPLYEAAADLHIHNDTDVFDNATQAAKEAIYEVFGYKRA